MRCKWNGCVSEIGLVVADYGTDSSWRERPAAGFLSWSPTAIRGLPFVNAGDSSSAQLAPVGGRFV